MKKLNLIRLFSLFIINSIYTYSIIHECLQLTDQNQNGCLIINSIENSILFYENEINEIENKSATTKRLKDALARETEKIGIIKNRNKINLLENNVESAEKQIKNIAYMTAESQFQLYQEISTVIKSIESDVYIKDLIQTIHKKKQELYTKLTPKIEKIKTIGSQIISKTAKQQNAVDAIKKNLLIAQEKLSTKLLEKNINQQFEAIQKEIESTQEKINNSIKLSLTSIEEKRIETINENKKRLSLLLRLIQDPKEILKLTLEEIINF